MKPIFHNISFLVHGRKSFRSYSLSIFGWTILLFLFCYSVLFSLVAKKCGVIFSNSWEENIEWFDDGHSTACENVLHVHRVSPLSPLSLCVYLFPSNRSGSTSPQNHSAVIKHPPPSSIYTLPLSLSLSIPLLVSVFPIYVQPSQALNETNAEPVLWLAGIELDWAHALSLSFTHSHTHTPSHTHVHENKQTQSRRLLRVRRAHAHACAAVLTHIDAPTHSQSLSIRWLQPWDEVMFWDRKHGAMGNSQRRAKGRHKTKGATGKAHTHVPVSHLDVCTDFSNAYSCTTSHSTMPRSYFTITSGVVHVIVCVCVCVCMCTCERISISVTGFMWLISVAAVVRVTAGFKITVRSLVIAVSSLNPLALSSLYPKKREKEWTKEVTSLKKRVPTQTQKSAGVGEDQREWGTK